MTGQKIPAAYEHDVDKAICATCGAQYAEELSSPPDGCKICLDERQYVPASGQSWTSLRQLLEKHVETKLEPYAEDPRVIRIKNYPGVAISQTPILLLTEHGCLIWDCSGYISPAALDTIRAHFTDERPFLGIAISHPHFYNSSATICRALREGLPGRSADAKVYVNSQDREWWTRTDDIDIVEFWDRDLNIFAEGIIMVRCGGHFPGSSVLYWDQASTKFGPKGNGIVLCSDTFMVAPDRKMISFMYSYPNAIPLPPSEVLNIWRAVQPYSFDHVLSAWSDREMHTNGRQRVLESARRFV